MKITKWRAAGLALVTTALVAAVVLSTASAKVHADEPRHLDRCEPHSCRHQLANAWASTNGATVKVVTKDFGSISSSLGTVATADAPDVVLAAHDWTGQLAANGLVQPLYPSRPRSSRSSRGTRSTRSPYGTAVKKLFGSRSRSRTSGCSSTRSSSRRSRRRSPRSRA